VSFPTVSQDGHYVIYNSSTGLYRYDTVADRTDRLLSQPMGDSGVLSPDDTKLAYYPSPTELDVLDLTTGERTVLVDGPQMQLGPGSLSFGANGRYLTYFTSTPDVRHSGAAWIADLSTGETTQLVAPTQYGERLQLSADAGVLLYTSFRGGRDDQHRPDRAVDRRRRVVGEPAVRRRQRHPHRDRRRRAVRCGRR
jgi:Tol biopolymer transport system component